MRTLPFTLLALLSAAPVFAANLKVPQQYATIGEAVIAAVQGDTVTIDEGLYQESVLVNFKTDITIRGKGEVIIDAGGADSAMVVNFSEGVQLKNLVFRNAAESGLAINVSFDTQVIDCELRDHALIGIASIYGSGTQIVDCEFDDVVGTGVHLYTSASHVARNRFVNCGSGPSGVGIYVIASHVSVEGNRLEGGGASAAIRAAQNESGSSFNILLVDNLVLAPLGDGIIIGDSTDAVIVDNVIKGAALDGIDVDSAGLRALLDGNVVTQPGDRGLEISADGVVASGNKIKKSTTAGIWISGVAADGTYYANKVKKSLGDGVQVYGDDNALMQNDVRGSTGFDFFFDGNLAQNVFTANVYDTMQL